MKETSIELSKELVGLGLNPRMTADMTWRVHENGYEELCYGWQQALNGAIPSWSLSALLAVLPVSVKIEIKQKSEMYDVGEYARFQLIKWCDPEQGIRYEASYVDDFGNTPYWRDEDDATTAVAKLIGDLLESGHLKRYKL